MVILIDVQEFFFIKFDYFIIGGGIVGFVVVFCLVEIFFFIIGVFEVGKSGYGDDNIDILVYFG